MAEYESKQRQMKAYFDHSRLRITGGTAKYAKCEGLILKCGDSNTTQHP